MDTTDLIAIIGLILFGIVMGVFAARSSNQREKLHGNQVARFFHYVACGLLSSIAPSVLVMALIIHPHWIDIAGLAVAPIVQMLAIALAMMGLALVCLMIFAVLEKPAKEAWQQAQIDRGWTEKDARESGL